MECGDDNELPESAGAERYRERFRSRQARTHTADGAMALEIVLPSPVGEWASNSIWLWSGEPVIGNALVRTYATRRNGGEGSRHPRARLGPHDSLASPSRRVRPSDHTNSTTRRYAHCWAPPIKNRMPKKNLKPPPLALTICLRFPLFPRGIDL